MMPAKALRQAQGDTTLKVLELKSFCQAEPGEALKHDFSSFIHSMPQPFLINPNSC